jgi:hypothetical protein
MLTGRRLWDGESGQEIMIRALRERPRAPSTFNRKVSRALDAIVQRGLDNDPSIRFTNARQMAKALEQVGSIASQTEVGDWVALVAHQDLPRLSALMVENPGADISSPPMTSELRPRTSKWAPPPLPIIPAAPAIPMFAQANSAREARASERPPLAPMIEADVALAAQRFGKARTMTIAIVIAISAMLALSGIAAAALAIVS